MGSLAMAGVYFALMLTCLWVALKSQQDSASKECQRRSNDCQTRILPDSAKAR
jgi:hypothetical protein